MNLRGYEVGEVVGVDLRAYEVGGGHGRWQMWEEFEECG